MFALRINNERAHKKEEIITDTFFGGAEKKAAKAQTAAIREGQEITKEATEQARKDVMNLYPQARQDALGGFQGALDVFNQALPQQASLFQQGNVGAQQALLAGLPQIQNAILGGEIDYSGFQPTVMQQPDFSFANQNIMPAAQPNPADVLSPFSQGAASNAQSLGVNPYFSGGGIAGNMLNGVIGKVINQANSQGGQNILAGNQPQQTALGKIMGNQLGTGFRLF